MTWSGNVKTYSPSNDLDIRRAMRTWEEIKLDGSEHYKSGQTEVIDLLRHIQPHPSLSVVEIKALADNIKYAYRQLTRGIKESDLEKMIHYCEIAGAASDKK